MKTVVTFALFLCTTCCLAQQASIVKITNGDQVHLAIAVVTDTGRTICDTGCYMKPVADLSDTVKLNLLYQAFNFLDDAAVSYDSVQTLESHKSSNNREVPYNLQIDALVLINYIAFSGDAAAYCPYPVLFDKADSTRFTTNGPRLAAVIQAYKNWFEGIRQTGFRDYTLPLCSDRYEWLASRTVRRVYHEYPGWLKIYDCIPPDLRHPAP